MTAASRSVKESCCQRRRFSSEVSLSAKEANYTMKEDESGFVFNKFRESIPPKRLRLLSRTLARLARLKDFAAKGVFLFEFP